MSTSIFQSLFRNFKSTPSNVVLVLLWLIAVVGVIGSLLPSLNRLTVVVGLSSFAFIVILIWTLAQKKPYSTDLPNMDFLLTPPIGFGTATTALVAAIGIAFVIGMMIGTAVSLTSISALIGTGITLSWRTQLKTQTILGGISASFIAGLGTMFLGNGDLSWAIFNFIVILPLFIAGALLVSHTGLANVRLLQGDYTRGLKGFLWACVLAVPASLLNLFGNLQQGDIWVSHWWQPFYAIVPGVAEETWARLFFTTFCYALLRPTTNQHPRRAIVVAILFGALVHSFAHTGINPLGLVVGGLLYFVPSALLFIKYDFEHAIGYHFLIDFFRFSAALFQG
jgi:hypothetical protein